MVTTTPLEEMSENPIKFAHHGAKKSTSAGGSSNARVALCSAPAAATRAFNRGGSDWGNATKNAGRTNVRDAPTECMDTEEL